MATLPRLCLIGCALTGLAMSPAGAAPGSATRAASESASSGAALAAQIVACYVEKESSAGMSFAVFHDGELVQSRGFGWADVEQRVPVTPETRFRLASVSKLFAAGAVAALSQQGRLDVDAPIRTYVAAFPEKKWPVSIRQIAAHIGGIRGYEDKDFAPGSNIDLRAYASTDEALGVFADDPLLWEPGSGYRYSTFGFTLLAAAVESVTGKPYGDFLKSDFLEPIGVTSIAPDDQTQLMPQRGRFYDVARDGRLVNAEYVRSDYKAAGGGLIGTAEDLARYGDAHLRPGLFAERTLGQLLFKPQPRNDGRSTHVGLAWRVGADDQLGRVYHHSGSLPGARSVLMLWPDRALSLAAMSNTSDAPHNAEDFAATLSHVILDARPVAADDAWPRNALSLDLSFALPAAEEVRHLTMNREVPCSGSLQTPAYLRTELAERGYASPDRLNVMGSYRLASGGIAVVVASRLGLHRVEMDAPGGKGAMVGLNNKFSWSATRQPFAIR